LISFAERALLVFESLDALDKRFELRTRDAPDIRHDLLSPLLLPPPTAAGQLPPASCLINATARQQGVIHREKAPMGLFVTLEPPTEPMRVEPTGGGFYDTLCGKHPRIQLVTIADLLAVSDPICR
jgi:hypothetical protein